MNIIKVDNINKIFRVSQNVQGFKANILSIFKSSKFNIHALKNITFAVDEGEIIALIGPNGAGKSTLIKLLTGVLYPTSGYASVLGIVPWLERKKLAFQIGTIFGQKSNLWYHLPPIDTLKLLAYVYEIPPYEAKKRIDRLVDIFNIRPFANIPVRKISLGQRMRCELASSLLHNPKILFLDEPSIGLDIIAKHELRDYIKLINSENRTTVIITSHDVDDIEYLSQRVIIINHGQVVKDTSLTDLKGNYLKEKYVELHLYEPTNIPAIKGISIIYNKGVDIKIKIDSEIVKIEKILSGFIGSGNVIDISITDPPMEDIISRIYTKEGT